MEAERKGTPRINIRLTALNVKKRIKIYAESSEELVLNHNEQLMHKLLDIMFFPLLFSTFVGPAEKGV